MGGRARGEASPPEGAVKPVLSSRRRGSRVRLVRGACCGARLPLVGHERRAGGSCGGRWCGEQTGLRHFCFSVQDSISYSTEKNTAYTYNLRNNSNQLCHLGNLVFSWSQCSIYNTMSKQSPCSEIMYRTQVSHPNYYFSSPAVPPESVTHAGTVLFMYYILAQLLWTLPFQTLHVSWWSKSLSYLSAHHRALTDGPCVHTYGFKNK